MTTSLSFALEIVLFKSATESKWVIVVDMGCYWMADRRLLRLGLSDIQESQVGVRGTDAVDVRLSEHV